MPTTALGIQEPGPSKGPLGKPWLVEPRVEGVGPRACVEATSAGTGVPQVLGQIVRQSQLLEAPASERSGLAAVGLDLDRALREQAEKSLASAVASYYGFHQHPELSGQEHETAAELARGLRQAGLEVHENVGGTGVVGVLRSRKNPDGPVVLYRADMDALPVQEITGLPYASQNAGVMHACGHDLHMATALGTLQTLSALSDQWEGTVVFVGQPAEELGTGAAAVLADDRFRQILEAVGTKPKLALALHASPGPAGTVAVSPGYVSARADAVDIVIHGKGGHGAYPHRTVDPIVIGAQIVCDLQSIVSRKVAPSEPAVITVGAFQAGSKGNVIPPEAKLRLTVRSYSDEVRALLLDEIERRVVHIARAHGAPTDPEVRVLEGSCSAGYNDPAWTRRLRARLAQVLGPAQVGRYEPGMGAEDFWNFGQALGIPSVMYRVRVGSALAPGEEPGEGHTGSFAPEPWPALKTGILTMSAAIIEALAPHRIDDL